MTDILKHVIDPPVWVFVVVIVLLFLVMKHFIRRDNFYVLLVTIVVGFATVETLCRAFGLGAPNFSSWQEDKADGGPFYYLPSSILRYRYSSNPRGYFDSNNEVTGTINSKGFRGDEVDVEKTNGTIRIAVLGDSFTLGIGVRDEHTLPANLERILVEMNFNVEVLNFGVSGTATAFQVRYLQEYILAFEPDVVIFVVFLNDATKKDSIQFLGARHILNNIRNHSFFLNLFVGTIERYLLHAWMIRHYKESYRADAPGWQKVKSALTDAKQILDLHDIDMLISIYPVLFNLNSVYPFRDVHQEISEFARLNEIPNVDLFDALEGQADSDLWVHPSDQHPNELAHGLAAKTLAESIAQQLLLP